MGSMGGEQQRPQFTFSATLKHETRKPKTIPAMEAVPPARS